MSDYAPQVEASHYARGSYRSKERWISYWYQLKLVRGCAPRRVLEVGPGEGAVTRTLRAEGIEVTTYDIAPDVQPDIVGSITELSLADASVDLVLAAEVLEHIRWEDVPRALRELARVSRRHVIITVPHPGYVFSFSLKVPLAPRLNVLFQVPFFWERHVFNGEHYWELGKRGCPTRRLVSCARAIGLSLVSSQKFIDDPVHRFFVFEKDLS